MDPGGHPRRPGPELPALLPLGRRRLRADAGRGARAPCPILPLLRALRVGHRPGPHRPEGEGRPDPRAPRPQDRRPPLPGPPARPRGGRRLPHPHRGRRDQPGGPPPRAALVLHQQPRDPHPPPGPGEHRGQGGPRSAGPHAHRGRAQHHRGLHQRRLPLLRGQGLHPLPRLGRRHPPVGVADHPVRRRRPRQHRETRPHLHRLRAGRRPPRRLRQPALPHDEPALGPARGAAGRDAHRGVGRGRPRRRPGQRLRPLPAGPRSPVRAPALQALLGPEGPSLQAQPGQAARAPSAPVRYRPGGGAPVHLRAHPGGHRLGDRPRQRRAGQRPGGFGPSGPRHRPAGRPRRLQGHQRRGPAHLGARHPGAHAPRGRHRPRVALALQARRRQAPVDLVQARPQSGPAGLPHRARCPGLPSGRWRPRHPQVGLHAGELLEVLVRHLGPQVPGGRAHPRLPPGLRAPGPPG